MMNAESRTLLIPHTLKLVELGSGKGAPVQDTFLRWDPQHGWSSGQEEKAFVFPSYALARRYASHILLIASQVWMPLKAADRPSSVHAHGTDCRGCGCTETFACPSHCAWAEPDLCSECASEYELEIWIVYKYPTDFPDKFVARRSLNGIITEEIITDDSIEGLRNKGPQGRFTIARAPENSPQIVETWI